MTEASEQAVIPAWVVPEHHQVVELHYVTHQCFELVGEVEAGGRLAAVEWVVGGGQAPVTHRRDAATWEQVRAESWVALCVAAKAAAPTEQDWARLGVSPRPAVVEDVDWAYGAWRTLAWLLGVRPDPPVELPKRDEAGELVGGPLYVTRPNPLSPIWQAAEARRRRERLEDARRHWQHVRRLADR